jgi:intracellular septation protein A
MGLFLGFAPWILYWILVSDNSYEEAAVAGLIAAVVIAVIGVSHGRRPKILDYGTIVWFGFLAIIAAPVDEVFFADWSYVLSNFALAAIVLVSIVVGEPFTRQYAREEVPRENWNSPIFMRATAVIAWVWLGAFLLMALSSIVAYENPDDELWWNWIIPIGLFLVAIKFTMWYPESLRGRSGQAPDARTI